MTSSVPTQQAAGCYRHRHPSAHPGHGRDRPPLVVGMHMHVPAFSHIARLGNAYAVVPVPWTPEIG